MALEYYERVGDKVKTLQLKSLVRDAKMRASKSKKQADITSCSISGTSKWINFFRECGLPIAVATNYAVIFTNHRIQKNMLADLNKEYLQEMGITTMGDIISILKMSKSVSDQDARNLVLTPRGKPDTISLKTSSQTIKSDLVVPFKKVRRVLPEQEGGYVIKMPNGNVRRTTRSTKEDSSKFAKSSVFRRLGLDSVVSSSTDVYDKQPHSTVSLKDSSVFSRLGRNSAQEASSTSDVVEHMGDDSFLQYKGVFKRLNAKPDVGTQYLGRRKPQSGLLNSKPQKMGISARLGMKSSPARKIGLTPEQTVSRFGGVFARLGPVKSTAMM
ncbi:hypothetical protein GQR58_016059 [Nymphon striatum]|nr:hypothetical protein GQR58_016059 [Nymphon striatum]